MDKYSPGILIFLLFALLVEAGCRKADTSCLSAEGNFQLGVAPAGFPDIPFPEGNEFTVARWELGKKLFYDPVLSIDSSLSCGSCHKLSLAFSDDRAFSPGVEGRPGKRNAPSLANVAYHPYFLREGGVPTLEMQILVPIQEENEFAHNIVDISAELVADSEYVQMSRAAYGRDPDPFVITRALSTFERSLVSGGSAYDAWLGGCDDALSAAEERGRALFFSERAQCSQCHGGINFTNYAFENNGLYANYADEGRMHLTGDSADLARFKVPSLRNVFLTGPYMHDGSMATLQEVVLHYNAGGAAHPNKSVLVRPLGLTDRELEDLVAFLGALTDWDFVSNPVFAE